MCVNFNYTKDIINKRLGIKHGMEHIIILLYTYDIVLLVETGEHLQD